MTLRGRLGENEMVLQVSDTGIGISKTDQERLFTEFFRASNARKVAEHGTGLGLTIVRRIVEAHQGRLEVSSEENKGTTFTVYLPVPDRTDQ